MLFETKQDKFRFVIYILAQFMGRLFAIYVVQIDTNCSKRERMLGKANFPGLISKD
jgi:hypothetical protein